MVLDKGAFQLKDYKLLYSKYGRVTFDSASLCVSNAKQKLDWERVASVFSAIETVVVLLFHLWFHSGGE